MSIIKNLIHHLIHYKLSIYLFSNLFIYPSYFQLMRISRWNIRISIKVKNNRNTTLCTKCTLVRQHLVSNTYRDPSLNLIGNFTVETVKTSLQRKGSSNIFRPPSPWFRPLCICLPFQRVVFVLIMSSLICWVTWPRPPMADCTQSK